MLTENSLLTLRKPNQLTSKVDCFFIKKIIY